MDKRIRSPNYPALSLPEALERVSTLYRAQHTHSAPREVIAKSMGYASLNGASATAISALNKYGLLERNGEELRVSERALRILHPHSPSERSAAIQEAAADPALFAELAERFPGRLPNEELLRNYLVRKGFAPAALSSVIVAYRETSEMVERETSGDHSTVNPTEELPNGSHSFASTSVAAAAPLSVNPSSPASERSIGRYDFEGGAYVRIAASGDLDTEEALDMVATLIELKRSELKKGNRRANVLAAPTISPEANTEDT